MLFFNKLQPTMVFISVILKHIYSQEEVSNHLIAMHIVVISLTSKKNHNGFVKHSV